MIHTVWVLMISRKAEQKKVKKGKRHVEKRQPQLVTLPLLKDEGQKLFAAAKERTQKFKEVIAKKH